MGKRFVASVILVSGVCSGCAWVFQDHLPSDYQSGRHEPRCSTASGWQVLDGFFAVANGLTAAAELATNNRSDQDNLILFSSIGWTLIHTLSLTSGHTWTNECEQALRAYDEVPSETPPPPPERVSAASPMPVANLEETTPVVSVPTRKIVHGARPVFCAVQRDDADRGICFLEESACAEARAKAPEAYSDCGSRSASACFNATAVIDGKRLTVCSITVKDCETQRAKKVSDPDYSDVGSQCGVYRADVELQSPYTQP